MDIALIVNPFASAVSEERVRVVEEELSRAGTVRTVLTERAGHGSTSPPRPRRRRWSSTPATAGSTRC
jgi:hypothetical protein